MGYGIVDLSMTGMEEVQQFFDQPSTVAERREIASALEQGGELVIDAARRRIHSISGNLADSLQTSTTVGKYKTVATVHHGSGGAHDHLVEYGHAPGGWNKGDQYVMPHPYLYPAFEEQKKAAFEKIKSAVAGVVKHR